MEAARRADTLDSKVATLAQLIERYAASILAGDVSRIEILERLSAKLHRARNLELTGTASGGMQMDTRPSLDELFASADGAEFPTDVVMIAIYQAVADHHYSVEDVAEFLGLDSGDVKMIVDALDDVGDAAVSMDELRALIRRRS
jgi:hypothetical protein